MKLPATREEKIHMGQVKSLPCAVCGLMGKTEVQHLVNGYRLGHFFTIPLCIYCHRGDRGFSGKERSSWDKSLSHQFELLTTTYMLLGKPMPISVSTYITEYEKNLSH